MTYVRPFKLNLHNNEQKDVDFENKPSRNLD